MDVSMWDAAIDAAVNIFTLRALGFLSLGVIIGLVLGVIPGLGGLVGLSLLEGPARVADTADGEPAAAQLLTQQVDRRDRLPLLVLDEARQCREDDVVGTIPRRGGRRG